MKIIHISDLHLDYKNKINNFDKLISLLEYINKIGFDHLVITGDVTHTGQKYDLRSLRDLLFEYNLLNAKKTTIIIGNHDIFGGVVTAEDVVTFPSCCRKINFSEKVEEFHNYFSELYDNCIFPYGENKYPFIKLLDDIVLIGINSVAEYSLFNNPLASNGKIGKKQLKALRSELVNSKYENKTKIVLSHHHFAQFVKDSAHLNNPLWDKIEKNTMKLRGKKKILKTFRQSGIDLVFHGHIHKNCYYEKKGIRFINAGDSIDNTYRTNFRLNLIEINDGKLVVDRISSFIQDDMVPVKVYF
jgi:3',5'-cyclic AMP phosphodiesterase CpdA